MDNIFENTDIWIGAVAEIINKYLTAGLNLIIETIGITTDITNIIKPSDGLFLELINYSKQFIELMTFDYFQLQLLKIFISILVTIIFMIFCAWYIYGARITERFMDSAHKIEDRNNFKYYSPNL